MQRLIDAKEAKKSIEQAFLQHRLGTFTIGDVCDCIDNQPTIDAEPVVRCKDCKYHIEHKCSPAFYKCKQVSFLKSRLVSSKFGCVLGAKMDEEQEE